MIAAAGLITSNILVGYAGLVVVGSVMMAVGAPRLSAATSARQVLNIFRWTFGVGFLALAIWMGLTFRIEAGVGGAVLCVLAVAIASVLMRFTRDDDPTGGTPKDS